MNVSSDNYAYNIYCMKKGVIKPKTKNVRQITEK